ncbi:Rad9, partial [Oesophagostomum dentatum]
TALTIFKSAHFVEKNLVSCKLTVDCLGEDLHIDFEHTYDISRSFDVNVMEIHKAFATNVNRNDLLNAVTVSALDIASFLNEMHTGREELIMRAQEDKVVFKNYVPCEDDTSEGFGCRTEITVQKSCFKHYAVQKASEVSFSLKEFKSIITFARQHSCDVSLFFDRPGSPLIVAVESDAGYSAEFIIATLDGDDQSDEDADATQEPVDSAALRAQYSKGIVSGTPGRTSLRSQTKYPRLNVPAPPGSNQLSDEETETVEQNEASQRNTDEEEDPEMGPTQPSRNPLLSDSLMETVSIA